MRLGNDVSLTLPDDIKEHMIGKDISNVLMGLADDTGGVDWIEIWLSDGTYLYMDAGTISIQDMLLDEDVK